MNTVFTRIYGEPPISKNEILRYAGVKGRSEQTEELLEECLKECAGAFTYKVCYGEFEVMFNNGVFDLGFTSFISKNLEKNLIGASSVIIFAATIGVKIDRLIAKNSATSPSKALLFQAIGTERIEALCDIFNKEIALEKNAKGYITLPRYSPGYGDLSLDIQKQLCVALDCHRKIGISLSKELLMSPTKSVTAIIGLKKKA